MTSRIIAAVAMACLIIPTTSASDLYFPGDQWESVDPSAIGWDSEKLASAVKFAMSRNTSGIVVLHRGRILAETYREVQPKSVRYRRMIHGRDRDGRTIEDVASVQKSIVSFLVGVAQEKGLVKISDPVHRSLDAGWSMAKPEQESAITIRHLITMSSGLNDRLEFDVRPGTKWKYNTVAYSKCLLALAAVSQTSPNELTSEWLTHQIGMKNSRWVSRARTPIRGGVSNRYGFATTARDLARFGLLILARGTWGGDVLLADQKYLRASMSPSQKMNQSYGYLWWLNGQESSVRRMSLIPAAPADLIAARGALGRKCYVVPSMELVVTRLGGSPEKAGAPGFENKFWSLLMKAAPR